ncbi:MAG: 1-deoxy-D-xylulose-5-phosphate reductoisomerase [Endomicrobiales bacterium]|jgi:1-deoxy-D-xylulose-5-phosphate reductoisomerase
MKKIVILGSTGSIGTQALDVVRLHPQYFSVVGLAGRSNVSLMKRHIKEFRPRIAAVWSDEDAADLSGWCKKLRLTTRIVSGLPGLLSVARLASADIVLSAVVGSIGLEPLMAAIAAGKTIALANKEALVVAGELIMAAAQKNGVTILPVDSEHSAIFQCLKNEKKSAVRRIMLTASGGPFYRCSKNPADITVDDALNHPTWKMGKKITIDSATLMNKGLEAIEASHLFGVGLDRIDIVIHPQSIVHSLVEYVDHCVIAQMSLPDMRLPIQYALSYPDRMPSSVRPLDLSALGGLTFDVPDFRRFPCLDLALSAGKRGGTMPAVMNAANEVAVGRFLNGDIRFTDIANIISSAMKSHRVVRRPELSEIIAADAEARVVAQKVRYR